MTAPKPVHVSLGVHSYDVHVGSDATARAAAAVRERAPQARVFLFSDENVAESHGQAARARLEAVGFPVQLRSLPAGEAAKTMTTVEQCARYLVANGVERGDVVVGVGGGAATDVAGFVAATTLRGLRWVSVPTTLLGQVDAAVGGKTGVNLPEGKNLVGSFHQPLVVACDPATLVTLAPREFRAGLAEVVKTAWIGDPELFAALESDPPLTAQHAATPDTVRRCVAVKSGIVSEDERETGRRAQLNFGHTLGHAIETWAAPRFLHGEAVAMGLVAALHLSVSTGRCPADLLDRMVALLERMGLPTGDRGLDVDAVLDLTRRDKKRTGGKDRYQLTTGIGFVSVATDIPEGAPRAALEFLRR